MHAEIVVVEHTLAARAPQGWWLGVVWQFRNLAQRPLYVLSDGPQWIVDAQPLVLNHALEDHLPGVDPYVDPHMEFAVVEAHASLDLRRSYPLPPVDLRTPRAVVGRFAVSYERPDPGWPQGHAWDAVKQWQQVLESLPFQLLAPLE